MSLEKLNVLELCDIPSSIDLEKLKENVKSYMEPRLKYYKEHNSKLCIEYNFSEYFVADASNGNEIGKGNCKMDVKTNKDEGIDVTCVVMNNTKSNEKSVIQNFKSSGCNLDILFTNKKDTEAVSLFMDDYKNELIKVKTEHKLKQLFILAFISTETKIYLACFNINIDNIKYVISNGFITNKSEEDIVNISIGNFIDNKYGYVNLYKSKKRVELRFDRELLQMPKVVNIYSI